MSEYPPFPWSEADAGLIKRLWLDDGGRRALSLIIEAVAGIDTSSMSRDPYTTAYLEGRRSIAIDLTRAIKMPLEAFAKQEERSVGRPRTATERARDADSPGRG